MTTPETVYVVAGNGRAVPKDPNQRDPAMRRHAGAHPKLVAAGAPKGAVLEVPPVPSSEESAAAADAIAPARLAIYVKAEAARRIEAVYPDWKQSNLQTEALFYIDIRIAGEALTEEQQARAAALREAKAWIDSVRQASNDLEATIAGMTDAARSDLDVMDDAHWPANPKQPA